MALVADGLVADGELAILVNELEAHLADPATITLYCLLCQAAGLDGHHTPDPSADCTTRSGLAKRLDMTRAYARVRLPMHLNWSAPGRVFDLGSRADRARLYEIVLQEGRPADILASVDGALLVDLWDERCYRGRSGQRGRRWSMRPAMAA